jgi:hypothetical protein
MATLSERLRDLANDLEVGCAENRRLAKTCHFWLMVLTGVTIAASAAAGLLGLGFDVDTRIVGAVALIPGIAASILQQFKVPAKTDFHYRKWDALRALQRRLRYEMPEKPKVADVARISAALSRLEADMTLEWQKVVGSNAYLRQPARE